MKKSNYLFILIPVIVICQTGISTFGQTAGVSKQKDPDYSIFDFSTICVDSIWYDTLNPGFINITVYNGSNIQINYPSVQIVSPSGDTIGNPSNSVAFFAHLNGVYLTYLDTITVSGITDFSGYTFLFSEDFGTTTNIITFCNTNGIQSVSFPSIILFPNPSNDKLLIQCSESNNNFTFEIADLQGGIFESKTINGSSVLDISNLKNGVYFARFKFKNGVSVLRFIKQ